MATFLLCPVKQLYAHQLLPRADLLGNRRLGNVHFFRPFNQFIVRLRNRERKIIFQKQASAGKTVKDDELPLFLFVSSWYNL